MRPAFGENYSFRWGDLGDIALGRPNLGTMVPVPIYRLALYTLRETLVQRYDDDTAAACLREAGWMAGRELCNSQLDRSLEMPAFLDRLQAVLRDLYIGIMRLEKVDMVAMTFTMTVSEDLDCSGLQVLGKTVCEYDEGFIAGVLHAYTGRDFDAVEVDCWATGDRTCRFEVGPMST